MAGACRRAAMAAVSDMALLVCIISCCCCCCLQLGSAQTDCTKALAGVSGCLTFLSNPTSVPDNKTCCAPLSSVLTTPSSFQCLCAQASANSNSQTFQNALQLPKACKLAINVSEANCTTTSTSPAKSPPTSSTPPLPGSSTNSPAGNSSAGVAGASPESAIIALTAGLCSILSFFA